MLVIRRYHQELHNSQTPVPLKVIQQLCNLEVPVYLDRRLGTNVQKTDPGASLGGTHNSHKVCFNTNTRNHFQIGHPCLS